MQVLSAAIGSSAPTLAAHDGSFQAVADLDRLEDNLCAAENGKWACSGRAMVASGTI
jgi:hypothetical protein